MSMVVTLEQEVLQALVQVTNKLEDVGTSFASQDSNHLILESHQQWQTLASLMVKQRSSGSSEATTWLNDQVTKTILQLAQQVWNHLQLWEAQTIKDNQGFEQTVPCQVVRVICQLACHGKKIHDQIMRLQLIPPIVIYLSQKLDLVDAGSCVSLLQLFQSIACSARHRTQLFHANTVALALDMMALHALNRNVQVFGCQFLQFMAYEEDAKLQIIEKDGIHRVLVAFQNFSKESELAVAGSDLLYFLSLELEWDGNDGQMESDADHGESQSQRVNGLVCQIVDTMLHTMHRHLKQRQVQAQGIAILNNFVSYLPIQQLVCDFKSLFELIAAALDANEEARDDTVDFVATLFTNTTALDQICVTLETEPSAVAHKALGQIQGRLEQIRSQLLEKQQAIDLILQHVIALMEYITRLRTASSTLSDKEESREPLLLTPSSSPLSSVQERNREQHNDARQYFTDEERPQELFKDSSELSTMQRIDSTSSSIVSSSTTMSTNTITSVASNSNNQDRRSYDGLMGDRTQTRSAASQRDHISHHHDAQETLASSFSSQEEDNLSPTTLPEHSQSFLSEISRDIENGFFDRFLTVSPRRILRGLDSSSSHDSRLASRLPSSSATSRAIHQQSSPTPSSSPSRSPLSSSSTSNVQQQQQRPSHPSLSRSAIQEFQNAFQRLQQDQKTLMQHYQIVQRRCQEQSRLLRIQNSRIESQRHIHEQLLSRTLFLEKHLESANQKMGVEKEMRHAEVSQSQKMSQALAHAMREIKELNHQNQAHASQLLQKEKLRLDMQQRHGQLKSQHDFLGQEKQNLVQANQELIKTNQQLALRMEEMAFEHRNTLEMREQDLDTPAPQLIKRFLPSLQNHHQSMTNASSVHYLSWKNRAKSLAMAGRSQSTQSARTTGAIQMFHHQQKQYQSGRSRNSVAYFAPSTSSTGSTKEPSPLPAHATTTTTTAVAARRLTSPATTFSSRNNGRDMQEQQANDRDFTRQPAKDRSMSVIMPGSPDHKTRAQSLEAGERTTTNGDRRSSNSRLVEQKLRFAFETLDTSIAINGTSEPGNGSVHVAVVRRFLLECGLVQPPTLVASELDLILSKVLKIAFANRKSQIANNSRSLFLRSNTNLSSSCLGNCKSLAPLFTKSRSNKLDVTRQRYFDFETFCEALLLLGMKRFPRLEVDKMLEKVAVEFLEPCAQKIRANDSNNRLTLLRHNGSHSNGDGGSCRRRLSVASESAMTCSSAMKTILNGLLLRQTSTQKLRSNDNYSASGGPNEFRRVLGKDSSSAAVPSGNGREELLFAMLEMHSVLAREQKAIGAICDFYGTVHATRDAILVVSFDLVLNFALDFEIIPSFVDRVTIKYLYSEVSSLVKSYLAVYHKLPVANDGETLKKVAFSLILARLAREIFGSKPDYETPEKQITGFLQWMDNCAGREKLMRKSLVPIVIRFSSKLYSLKI